MSIVQNSVADAILGQNNLPYTLEARASPEVDSYYDSLSDDEVDFSKEEDLDDYRPGGYHPAKIGDIVGSKLQYQIIRKLGWGHFSTVWLAYNSIDCKHVALKIIKSADKYRQAAIDEIKILKRAGKGRDSHPGKKNVMKMLDYFSLSGPNGDHICMIFELLGENMLSLVYKFRDLYEQYQNLADTKRKNCGSNLSVSDSISFGEASTNILTLDKIFKDYYGGLPLSLVKRISRQVLLGLDYLHRECGLIHTDLKPENILIEIKNVDKVVELVRKEERITRLRKSSVVSTSSSSDSPLNKKKLSIITSGLSDSTLSFEQLTPTRRNTPIRSSKPLPSPILRKSSIWSCCYGDEGSDSSFSDRARSESLKTKSESISVSSDFSKLATAEFNKTTTSMFDKFSFAGETVESMNSSFNKMSIDENASSTKVSQLTSKLHSYASLEDELEELDQHINIKIADLGNSCYVDQHFAESIQTREYRCPEVLVQGNWGCGADIWSAGCLIFELITGSFAFRPKSKMSAHDRDAEHLLQMINMLIDEKHFWREKSNFDYYDEWFFDADGQFINRDLSKMPVPPPEGFDLQKITKTKQSDFYNTKGNKCGPFVFPYELYRKSRYGRRFFNSMVTKVISQSGSRKVRFKSLNKILEEKFHLPKAEAAEISDFLCRMLEIHPKYREDGGALTNHPWLKIKSGSGEYYEDFDNTIDRELGMSAEDIIGWDHEARSFPSYEDSIEESEESDEEVDDGDVEEINYTTCG